MNELKDRLREKLQPVIKDLTNEEQEYYLDLIICEVDSYLQSFFYTDPSKEELEDEKYI